MHIESERENPGLRYILLQPRNHVETVGTVIALGRSYKPAAAIVSAQ